MIPTLVGVSLLVTAFVRLLPGDAVDILVTENSVAGGNQAFIQLVNRHIERQGLDPATVDFATRKAAEDELIAEQLAKKGIDPATAGAAQRLEARNDLALVAYKDDIRRKLGIDKNYIEQWSDWMWNALQGDLGTSLVGGRSIADELTRRVPASFQLGLFAMLFGSAIAIPIGVISAVKQDTIADYSSRSLAIAMLALPSFFIATMAIAGGARWFDYSPPLFYEDLWKNPSVNLQLVLPPAIILGFALSGTVMRLTRAQMLEVLRQDYIRTAQAKGLAQRQVIVVHAVRNALLPVITVIGLQVPVLIGGSLVLEAIYGIPGVAQYLFISINNREFPAVIAINMIVAFVIVVTNLIVDVAYGYLDPRVTFS